MATQQPHDHGADRDVHNGGPSQANNSDSAESPQLVPMSVPPEVVVPALLDVILLDTLPDVEQLKEILTNACGPRLGEFSSSSENALNCEIDGNHLISIVMANHPPENPESMYRLHPVQTGDPTVVDGVNAQMMVALVPNDEAMEVERAFRQPRFAASVLHSQITAALATVEGARAVHSTATDVTFSAQFFHEAVSNNEYVMSLCSAWVLMGEEDASACTMGLAALGHPEVAVEKTTMDPTELYHLVLSVANYIIHGESLSPGDTMGLAEGGPSISIAEGSHPAGDNVPALRLEISAS